MEAEFRALRAENERLLDHINKIHAAFNTAYTALTEAVVGGGDDV